MSYRGRTQRAGRCNFWLSALVLFLLFMWVFSAQRAGGTSMARVSFASMSAMAATITGTIGGWVGWRTPRAHRRHRAIRQMSTMGWSAIVLWIINIVAAVWSGFQDEGAIKQSLDAEKLNHDALIFCASCFVCACLLYSNARLVYNARRCRQRLETKTRGSKRLEERGAGGHHPLVEVEIEVEGDML